MENADFRKECLQFAVFSAILILNILYNPIMEGGNKNGFYIFEGLTSKEMAYFIMMSETLHFRKQDVIMSEGDESDNRAYFIESGSVDVYRQGSKIASLHSGDVFGELALVADEPRSATVVSNDDLEVLVFSKDEFILLCKKTGIYDDIKWKILSRVKDNFYQSR